MTQPPPRWFPERPFPTYSYVPGRFPHPIRDPAGHSYGHAMEAVPAPTESDWMRCSAYTWGFDLFHGGYYWESHESWESVWLALGRTSKPALLVKALIKLAAAGVKVREGRPDGTRRHALRAVQILGELGSRQLLGVRIPELTQSITAFVESTEPVRLDEGPIPIVFPFSIALARTEPES